MHLRACISWLLCLALLFVYGRLGLAEMGSGGFNCEVSDIKALGKGQTCVASADTPAAIAGNPAGLTQLQGTLLSGGMSMVTLGTEYATENRSFTERMKRQYFFIPSFFITTDFKQENLRAGIGLTSPYGLGTWWDNHSFSKYISTKRYVEFINVNPTIAYKINDVFSFGVGLDLMISRIDRKKMFNVTATNRSLGAATNNEPDAEIHIKAHDYQSYGYNLGILVQPNNRHSFGLSYRSKISIDYDGTLDAGGLSGACATVFGGTSYSTRLNAKLTLPQSLGAGYAYKPNAQWLIETNIQWTGWDSVKQDFMDFYQETDATRQALLYVDNPLAKNWHSTMSVGTGVEYKATKALALRTGYYFYQTPVPENGFDTSLPDANRHYMTAGFGYQWKNWTFDTGYAVGFFLARKVRNTVGASSQASINGEYKTIVQTVGLAQVTYKFD